MLRKQTGQRPDLALVAASPNGNDKRNKTLPVRFLFDRSEGTANMENQTNKPSQPGSKDMQGEGNYDAARKYDAEQEAFAADGEKVKRKAREAADALDGEEGDALRDAEKKTGEKGK